MISEIIKTKNAKTLVYYDTPYTKATKNGFVFNIIEWRERVIALRRVTRSYTVNFLNLVFVIF